MGLREIIAESFKSLARNRTRSLLTMLGIAWGLVTVVLLLSYGRSLGAAVYTAFLGIGNNVRNVKAGDRVLYNPDDQLEVEIQGSTYLVMRERDVHADAAERTEHGPRCIEGGGLLTSSPAVQSRLTLAPDFVFFDEGGARAEDGREGQKQTADRCPRSGC